MFGKLGIMIERRVPINLNETTQTMLNFAGEDIPPERWMADTILLSVFTGIFFAGLYILLGMSLLDSNIMYIISRHPWVTIAFTFAITSGAVLLMRYLLVSLRIDDRKRRCQDILPDFLSVVSMNIAAGMEPLTALYISLRPDFNPITDEMKKIRSLSLGSKSIVDQLSLLKTRIDSNSLKTTVAVIERAASAGGDLGTLLDSVAQDLREANKIQKELETATKGYVTFIAFLAIFGIPLLLSVSNLFLSMVTVPTVSDGFSSMLPIGTGGNPIPTNQIEILFLVLIISGAISSSIIFSVLWKGEMKQGIKYIPIMVPLSVIVFFVCRETLRTVLGTFIGTI